MTDKSTSSLSSNSQKDTAPLISAWSVDDSMRVSFELQDTRIVEHVSHSLESKWASFRSDLSEAFTSGSSSVAVGFLHWPKERFTDYPFRANSRSIQIGCMRFTGKNASALRQWIQGGTL